MRVEVCTPWLGDGLCLWHPPGYLEVPRKHRVTPGIQTYSGRVYGGGGGRNSSEFKVRNFYFFLKVREKLGNVWKKSQF